MKDKYLKHEQPTQKTRKPITNSRVATVPPVAQGLDTELLSLALEDLNESVDKIGRTVADYAHNATLGENMICLFTGKDNCPPLRLVLEGGAVDKIASALCRIAAALEKM